MKDNKKSKRYSNCSDQKYLIACDLDGTLLNDDSELSKLTIAGVKKIVDAGHLFCIVTGRPVNGALNYYNQLKLNSIMITQNGACISKPCDMSFQPIIIGFSFEICKKIFMNKVLMSYVKNALIQGVNKCWFWKDIETNKVTGKMLEIFHLNNKDLNTLHGNLNKIDTDITSILFHVDIEHDFHTLLYEIKSIAPTLVVRSWSLKSDGVIVEINSDFASKGTAVKYLSSYYGIPRERCLAIGDGDNDVEMLTYAIGFATKDASDPARLSSRFMTKHSNNDDGVVRELAKFLKI